MSNQVTVCPYASELGDDEGIPSGVFVTPGLSRRAQELREHGVLERVQDIAKAHRVTLEELLGKCRQDHIVEARHRAWYEIYVSEPGKWSYPRIAKLFGVEWTSVRHAVHKGTKERQRMAQLAALRKAVAA